MSRSSPWNLISSGSHDDVKIRVEESLQHDDRYRVIVRVGSFEFELMCRELDFLGIWLGMCSLEMGRGIDLSNDAEGINGDHLRLMRDLAGGQLQIEHVSSARSDVHILSNNQVISLSRALEHVLRELG